MAKNNYFLYSIVYQEYILFFLSSSQAMEGNASVNTQVQLIYLLILRIWVYIFLMILIQIPII